MEDMNVTTGAPEEDGTTVEETVKTYTQEEVEASLQSEADRRVTAALKKAEISADERAGEIRLSVRAA